MVGGVLVGVNLHFFVELLTTALATLLRNVVQITAMTLLLGFGQVVTFFTVRRGGVAIEDRAAVFMVMVTGNDLGESGATFCLVEFTTELVVRVRRQLPLDIGTVFGVFLETLLFQGMVLNNVRVFAALRLLGVVMATGDELGVEHAIHWFVHTWLVTHVTFGGITEFLQGTAFGLVSVSFVLDNSLAWLDLLTESGVNIVIISVQVSATILVIITLSDLLFAIGIQENGTAAILVLRSHNILRQDVLTL